MIVKHVVRCSSVGPHSDVVLIALFKQGIVPQRSEDLYPTEILDGLEISASIGGSHLKINGLSKVSEARRLLIEDQVNLEGKSAHYSA